MAKSLEQALLRISELEEKIENQQIIIDALVARMKKMAGSDTSIALEKCCKEQEECNPRKEISQDMVRLEFRKEEGKKDRKDGLSFEEEIEDLFRRDKVPKQFKDTFTIEALISYSKESHSFSLNSRVDVKMKKSFHTNVKQQIDKISRHIMVNLNTYDLNTICSTLNLISGDLEYQHKLVTAHDIILFIDDFSRIPFIISALFNNQGIRNDVLGETIKEILLHQCMVDSDIHKNHPHIVSYYNKIVSNFELHPKEKSLKDICANLVVSFDVFENGAFNPMIFPSMYSVRALCHYMDWDYAYNEFICTVLYPRLRETRDPLCAIYMSTVALNAMRVFGAIESVELVFEKLKEFMNDASDLSITIYLFIKQIDPQRANVWYESQVERINHVDGEYLKNLLLY
ncbi:uncharacterized protein Eint_090250 [Encephalitozoon intestinalis ATCC 50506]|uniref:Uncharacterized protein n=1 Tax=Encephalitozoon intestinalis (strain ATCC 50506) TaxID=876142 RepID=E0S973_ENCIT|nr:uncharacterized protein Eint_090250 [Encephalitozoon intestinalis ATCC 50506]ADM12155.1 hypothetical protein Eint_090250 [Encephalitozoon intestinalis ATCC 50506]UTX45956.1 DUF5087 domain-containing protein [Encephalitozoon intestinalis]